MILTPFDIYVQGADGKKKTIFVDSEVSTPIEFVIHIPLPTCMPNNGALGEGRGYCQGALNIMTLGSYIQGMSVACTKSHMSHMSGG